MVTVWIKVNDVGVGVNKGTPKPVPVKVTVWVDPLVTIFMALPLAGPGTVGLNLTYTFWVDVLVGKSVLVKPNELVQFVAPSFDIWYGAAVVTVIGVTAVILAPVIV